MNDEIMSATKQYWTGNAESDAIFDALTNEQLDAAKVIAESWGEKPRNINWDMIAEIYAVMRRQETISTGRPKRAKGATGLAKAFVTRAFTDNPDNPMGQADLQRYAKTLGIALSKTPVNIALNRLVDSGFIESVLGTRLYRLANVENQGKPLS